MEFDDIRFELVAIARATATLPCACPRVGPACLACRAAAAVDDMTARGLRMHRWRNTAPAPRAVVHVAGDVVDERMPRPGMPRFIADRRQLCASCGVELVRGRWALFYDVGALVAVRESRSGPGGAGLVFPAGGSSWEDPCWQRALSANKDSTKPSLSKSHETRPSSGSMTVMKFVAYVRVSTDTQADDGLGLQVQEQDCREWATDHKHKIIHVATDAGRSGTDSLADRPGLAEALGWVRAGKAAGIVVQRLDRLARDIVIQETFLAEMHSRKWAFHSTSGTEDVHLDDNPDDPTRALVRRILSSISMYEREMIRLRLTAGMQAKLANGGYGGGRPGYGWRAVGRELEKDPAEQLVLRKMIAMRKRGLGGASTAHELNAAGLTARNGGPWHANGVDRIVTRNMTSPGSTSRGPFARRGGTPREIVAAK